MSNCELEKPNSHIGVLMNFSLCTLVQNKMSSVTLDWAWACMSKIEPFNTWMLFKWLWSFLHAPSKRNPQVGLDLTNFLSSQSKVVGDFGLNFWSASLKTNVFINIYCDGGLGFGQVDNFCLVVRPWWVGHIANSNVPKDNIVSVRWLGSVIFVPKYEIPTSLLFACLGSQKIWRMSLNSACIVINLRLRSIIRVFKLM